MNGMIIKAIAGFYYVEAGNAVYECKARGVFRKNSYTPLVGDRVAISEIKEDKGVVETILERKNELVRPPIANLDRLFIVASVADPAPNLFVLDELTAIAVEKDIEPVILINKCDLLNGEDLAEIYRSAGFTCISLSAKTGFDSVDIKELIKDKTCAFTGNSGVGKSSILNEIHPALDLAVSETSKKLGRGRHTTRHVELHKICGGYVADTPGFSSMDITQYAYIPHENLAFCFPEFSDYLSSCKFTSCSHTSEKGCAVLEAAKEGRIKPSRLNSYRQMYETFKKIPDWSVKK